MEVLDKIYDNVCNASGSKPKYTFPELVEEVTKEFEKYSL